MSEDKKQYVAYHGERSCAKDDPVIQELLVELSALLKKYDAGIGGCGCCESPWLIVGRDDERRVYWHLDIDGEGVH